MLFLYHCHYVTIISWLCSSNAFVDLDHVLIKPWRKLLFKVNDNVIKTLSINIAPVLVVLASKRYFLLVFAILTAKNISNVYNVDCEKEFPYKERMNVKRKPVVKWDFMEH